MRRIVIILTFLLVFSQTAWAVTSIEHTLKSSGGDYSNPAVWEANSDDIDYSADYVVTGVSINSGSFPSNGTTIDDGAGNSAVVCGVLNGSNEAVLRDITGSLSNDTEFCDVTDTDCIQWTANDNIGEWALRVYGAWDAGATLTFAGATNTSATSHRTLIGDSFTATGTAHFDNTGTDTATLSIAENYFVLRNLTLTINTTNASDAWVVAITNNGVRVDACAIKDAANAGAGSAHGLKTTTTDNVLIYRTIAEGCAGSGFQISAGAGETTAVICSTAKGNGAYGFENTGSGTEILWNNYGEDNTTADFETTASEWDSPSGYNASKDATYALGITATGGQVDLNLDADGLAQDSTNMYGANYGQNPYNDVTATIDFDDFFRNDTAGSSYSKLDILGDSRPNEGVADSDWHVGADQYPAESSATPTYIPKVVVY